MEHDINNLKTEVAVINEKLDNQSKKLDSLISMVEGHIKTEDIKYTELTEKKADRTEVERIQANLSKVVWILIVAVVGAILKLVLIS